MKEVNKELTEVYGPSGDEDNIGNIIFEKIKPFADYISLTKWKPYCKKNWTQ